MPSPLEGRPVALGVTGSIAAYKAVDLVSKLVQAGALVDVVAEDRVAGCVRSAGHRQTDGAQADDSDLRLARGDAFTELVERGLEGAEFGSHGKRWTKGRGGYSGDRRRESGGDGAEGRNQTLQGAFEEGARVEDHGVVCDAREDRGLAVAQGGGEGIG